MIFSVMTYVNAELAQPCLHLSHWSTSHKAALWTHPSNVSQSSHQNRHIYSNEKSKCDTEMLWRLGHVVGWGGTEGG